MRFPAQYRAKLHSNDPLKRLNGEIRRHRMVVGFFPNHRAAKRIEAITQLIGALLLEQNDE